MFQGNSQDEVIAIIAVLLQVSGMAREGSKNHKMYNVTDNSNNTMCYLHTGTMPDENQPFMFLNKHFPTCIRILTHICSRRLLKTLQQKKILLTKGNFSYEAILFKIFHRSFKSSAANGLYVGKEFNPFHHTTILQQTTLNIFCKKIYNLYN